MFALKKNSNQKKKRILLKYNQSVVFRVSSKVIQLHIHTICRYVFLSDFSIIGYYNVLTVVPCAIQYLVVNLFYMY